jgi:hypothetical protein
MPKAKQKFKVKKKPALIEAPPQRNGSDEQHVQAAPADLPRMAEFGWQSIAAAATFLFAAIFIYGQSFTLRSFGPEFAYFYELNEGLSFSGLLHSYVEFGKNWYRPTEFYTPYWLLSKVISWHSVPYWKFAQFLTLLLACLAVYSLARLCFPDERLGAFLAGIYFLAHPAHYMVLFEISAFDFLHQSFVIASIGCFFLACRISGRRSWIFNACGVLCFVAAVTSKEITFITPVYLAIAAAAMLLFGERKGRRERLVRYSRLLAPYFLVLILYLSVHIARIPSRGADGQYRTKANVAVIVENTKKFPMWMIRVFSHTGDTIHEAEELATPLNDSVGYALLVLTVAQCAIDWRSRRRRLPAILMIAWVGTFLVLPSYAGGYIWHMSLVLPPYSVLLGVAISRMIQSARAPVLKTALVVIFIGGFMILGKDNLFATLHQGIHATAYRLNTETVLDSPPVPRAALAPNASIYLEDRLGMGQWNYGSGSLMRLAYLNKGIRETVVQSMEKTPPEAAIELIKQKNLYYFRYDGDLRWHDETKEFAAQLRSHVTRYTDGLFSEGKGKDVPDVLRPLLPMLGENGTVRYHYALGLQQQGHTEESLAEYSQAIRLIPDQFFAYYNRAELFASMNKRREACLDLRQAKSLNPAYPGLDGLERSACQ